MFPAFTAIEEARPGPHSGVVARPIEELARSRTRAMGERLRAEGYRGHFELDLLVDADTGEMYLGEMNPRVIGASSMTNVNAVAYGDMPLFLFHLLEFIGVDYECASPPKATTAIRGPTSASSWRAGG